MLMTLSPPGHRVPTVPVTLKLTHGGTTPSGAHEWLIWATRPEGEAATPHARPSELGSLWPRLTSALWSGVANAYLTTSHKGCVLRGPCDLAGLRKLGTVYEGGGFVYLTLLVAATRRTKDAAFRVRFGGLFSWAAVQLEDLESDWTRTGEPDLRASEQRYLLTLARSIAAEVSARLSAGYGLPPCVTSTEFEVTFDLRQTQANPLARARQVGRALLRACAALQVETQVYLSSPEYEAASGSALRCRLLQRIGTQAEVDGQQALQAEADEILAALIDQKNTAGLLDGHWFDPAMWSRRAITMGMVDRLQAAGAALAELRTLSLRWVVDALEGGTCAVSGRPSLAGRDFSEHRYLAAAHRAAEKLNQSNPCGPQVVVVDRETGRKVFEMSIEGEIQWAVYRSERFPTLY